MTRRASLYFDERHLPEPSDEYVAWVDVMGTMASMSRSVRTTANFVFKLHSAALGAPRSGVTLYPVMDGFYASSCSQSEMMGFLRNVFGEVAYTFIHEAELRHRFLIRGGLAYGPVIHGRALGDQASYILRDNSWYRACILLGLPMVQAHLSEEKAPPFGIYVHESARTFASQGERPLGDAWLSSIAERETRKGLEVALEAYFVWCEERNLRLDYPQDRIMEHRKMAKQFFIE